MYELYEIPSIYLPLFIRTCIAVMILKVTLHIIFETGTLFLSHNVLHGQFLNPSRVTQLYLLQQIEILSQYLENIQWTLFLAHVYWIENYSTDF